jgi:tetratricopeptide (TPR) repeat protein
MKIYRIIVLLLITTLLGCISGKIYNNQKKVSQDIYESEYYQIFTDATKYSIIPGNLKNAVSLYNLCISRYPYKAAPYFQLSEIYMHNQDLKKAHDYAVKAESLDTLNIWYKINLANIYQYENKYDSAALLYKKIVKINPSAENYYNLAMLYGQCDNNDEALAILNKLEKDFDKSKEVFMMKHNIFNSLRQYDSAVYELEILTQYFPDDISNYGILAEYLSGIGRNDYAKRVYKEALSMDSTNGLILLSYGDFYMKNENSDSAFYFYNKAFCYSDLQNDNKISVIFNFISDKELLANESDEIEQLLKCIENKDHDYKVYSVYANYYINLQQFEEAKSYLDSALSYEKKNYILWEQSIMIDNYLNDHKEAIERASECIKIFSEKPNPYLLRAYSEQALGEKDAAINDINTLLKLNPEKSIKIQAFNILAEIYRLKEDYNASDKCYEDILLMDPENLMIRNNYSYYLSVRGVKLERAKELSLFTIQKEPNNATYLDTYGWIMFKLGKLKEAKEYIESAIRFGAVNNAEVLDHFGQIMLKMGKCKDAIEAWERILEVDSTYSIKPRLIVVKDSCK